MLADEETEDVGGLATMASEGLCGGVCGDVIGSFLINPFCTTKVASEAKSNEKSVCNAITMSGANRDDPKVIVGVNTVILWWFLTAHILIVNVSGFRSKIKSVFLVVSWKNTASDNPAGSHVRVPGVL